MATARMTGMEDEIRKTLEGEIRAEISKRKIGPEELAKELGIFTSGAMTLMRQDSWPLETVFRLASLLDFDVKISIGKRA